MCGGVGHMGRHQNIWGCPNIWRTPHPPITCRYPLETYRCTGEHWEHMGMFQHNGVSGMYREVEIYERV